MGDYVYRLNLTAVLTNPAADEADRFRALAALASRRLYAMVGPMNDRDLVFESGEAESLASQFEQFSEDEDTGCLAFTRHWDDLCNWGETQVQSGRREKSLCAIPTLPQEFSC